jgi:UDP-N-acetyl-D-glucosamine dehydrogenase
MIRSELENLIAEKRAFVGVVGLGYVGLPLIVEFCLKGFNGIGFEVDAKKSADINNGLSHIVDVPDENVRKCIDSGKLAATTDFSRLANCDVVIICVPTLCANERSGHVVHSRCG